MMFKNLFTRVFNRFRNNPKFLKQGVNVRIGRNCIINSPMMMELGNNIYIGPNAVLYSIYKKIIIKDNVIIGPGVTMVSGDHNFKKIGIPIINNHEKELGDDEDIIIEEDVWIGANVTLLKGVRIGRGVVIAAGAVVTKSIPPYCIIGGVPSRVISKRFSLSQVVLHEELLYEKNNRLKKEQLSHLE